MFFNNRDNQGGQARRTLPLLPLRDLVVFPYMVVPLIVGRNPKNERYLATKAAKMGHLLDQK